MLCPASWFSCVQHYHWQVHFQKELIWVFFPLFCLTPLSSIFFRTQAGGKNTFMTYAVYNEVTTIWLI